MFYLFKNIFKILSKDDKKRFYFLCIITLFAALFEALSLGSFIPLIEQFSKVEMTPTLEIVNNFYDTSNLSGKESLKFLTFLILGIFIFKSLFSVFHLWHQSKFVHAAKINLSSSLFRNYINQKYLFHLNKNSSKLITNINIEVAVFTNVLMFLVKLFVQFFFSLGIVFLLFYVNKNIALILLFSSLTFGIFLYLVNRKRFANFGTSRIKSEESQNKNLFESFDAIKEILIFNLQKLFHKNYHINMSRTANIQRKFTFMNNLTRIWYEVFLISSMVAIILGMSFYNFNNSEIMATLGFYLIAALRLVPSLNEISTAYNYIKFASSSIKVLSEDILLSKNILENKIDNNERLPLKEAIEFINVSFSFSKGSKKVLEKVDFKILKNDFVAIIGETGAGKSTICDLLTGLIQPDSGKFLIDGKNAYEQVDRWKNNIGYVPQKIYLLDDTIKKNIAINSYESEINTEKVKKVIDESNIAQFVNKLPKGIETLVGENGAKVSGGEKQRIGIARALYRNPDLLIFDEATSSLDLETESNILKSLSKFKGNKTVVFITHRKVDQTIFNKVFELKDNSIKELN